MRSFLGGRPSARPPKPRRGEGGPVSPIAVTFRCHLYTKMNMNRNRRNPLITNDRCTLYSIKNSDFTRPQLRFPPPLPPHSYSTHWPGNVPRNPLQTNDRRTSTRHNFSFSCTGAFRLAAWTGASFDAARDAICHVARGATIIELRPLFWAGLPTR
jgi:hypothetical protein